MDSIAKWLEKHKAFFSDIPLFYKDGYAYFKKVIDESSWINCKRLLFYVILSLLISFFLVANDDTTTFTLATYSKNHLRNLLSWLPLGATAYYLSLFTTPNEHKIRLTLNYVIFQNTITVILLTIIWTYFINSEMYIIYYFYIFTGICLTLYFWYYFFRLFFYSTLQKLRGVAVFLSILTISSLLSISLNLLDIKHSLLYDPILPEVLKVSDINNDLSFTEKQVMRFQLLTNTTLHIFEKIKNPSSLRKDSFVFESEEIKKQAYEWRISKEYEIKRYQELLDSLEKLKTELKYNTSKQFVEQRIIRLKKQLVILEEYDKCLKILSDIDYLTLYKIKNDYLGQAVHADNMVMIDSDVFEVKSQQEKLQFAATILSESFISQLELVHQKSKYVETLKDYTNSATKIEKLFLLTDHPQP